MISINLNAIEEWERVRRDTTPMTPDVDESGGPRSPDLVEENNGTHGLRITRDRRRRRRRDDPESRERSTDESDAYELDIGHEERGLAAPQGPRAPIEPHQGKNVDVEA